jgi:hypothetical protein
VIIDGRVIMRGRELLTIDEEEVISQANSQAQELYLATEPQRRGI